MAEPFDLLMDLRRRGFRLEESSGDPVAIIGPPNLPADDLKKAAESIRPHQDWLLWLLAVERVCRCHVIGLTVNSRNGRRSFTFGERER